MNAAYVELLARMRGAATLSSIAELLGWDQETMMPPRAAEFRAEESALLASLIHERMVAPEIAGLLATCEASGELTQDPAIAASLREIRRDHERARKLPRELVAELSETASHALEAWKEARRTNDFDGFRPWLDRQLDLNRRKAACLGAPQGGDLYDALLDDFEPELTSGKVEQLFAPLRAELRELIGRIAGAEHRPSAESVELPVEVQRELHRAVLARIGFDLLTGRIDVSTHPFSVGIGPGDTRITTRFAPGMALDALGSTLHEAGHAMYEQGLPKAQRFGDPLAEPAGLVVHESQSRLWENHVGRSRAFWSWATSEFRRVAGPATFGPDEDSLYRSVNVVQPGLIRVEADEATYHLHVMLRFDLERAMLRGDLRTSDLPEAWNERIRKDLGIEVPDDSRGCLQDIHWSMGSIGYFPTYTLGSCLAAQLWETFAAQHVDIETRMATGDFTEILGWLRREIHAHGRRFRTDELCRRTTGRALDSAALMRHLNGKLLPLYGITVGSR